MLAFRWKILLDVGDNRLSWFRLLQLYLVGGFFNAFLPTGLGGDVMRVRLSGNTNKNYSGAFAAVFVERLLGIAGTVGIVLIGGWMCLGFVYGYDLRAIILGISAAILLCFLSIFHPKFHKRAINLLAGMKPCRIGEVLKKVADELQKYRYSMWRLGAGFILAFVVQFLFVVLHYFIGEALIGTDKLTIQPYFLISAMIGLGNFLPSVGGYGVREGSYILLLSAFDISKEAGCSYAVLADILILIFVFIGGITYIFHRKWKDLPSNSSKIEFDGKTILTGITG
jgi:glycosyltransferase 2 family protein